MFQASFFLLTYSLPLLLIVCLYSVMLHTLWNKVPTAVSLRYKYKSWHFSLESNYFTTIFLVEAIATDI